MPSGPGDKAQQPISTGFPGSNLYSNQNIWTSSFANARDRHLASKDSDENPTGSSALNANSEAVGWGSNPWNTTTAATASDTNPPRSVSTSPNRTRDGGISNGAGFYDNPHAAIGVKKGGPYAGKGFQDEAAGYNVPFATQKRSPQESAYIETMTGFTPSRDHSVGPSRQSQGSPVFPDLYRGHTPNNSISQRPMHHHSASLSAQTANQRAFNLNKQIEDDLAHQFGRHVSLDEGTNGSSFNPNSQPFQLNPGTQPWVIDEGGASRFGNALDFNGDVLAAQLAAAKRQATDRISPGSGYRVETGSGPRSYAPTPDPWSSRSPSRDPRPNDMDRRAAAQQFPANFHPSFYPNQYPFANLPPQYAPNFLDPYTQSFRHPILPGYGIQPVPGNYALGTSMPPIRPSRDQDPGKGMRSVVLDEFRMNNKSSKRYELKDIYNHVVEFSGDQHGSRFIQQKLETANSDEKEQVFREIEPNAIQLMKDVFGNYVVQKFFEHGNQVQKKILAEKMKGKVVDLSVQVYACRVVQKALEHVLVEQQAELTKELEPDILRVIRDQNGNHVVQKIIELVPRQYIDFIMDALRGQVTGLASHTYGCRVIQRMLEYGTEADKADIMGELHSSVQILITDQYGNYVAQHVLQNGKPEDRSRIISLVMSQLLTLSKHKFASNVVEKCIEYGSVEQRSNIREQLTTPGSDGTNPLQQMMRDQYGNYVIQKLLGQLQGSERDSFVEDIKPQFFALKKNGASRQLQALEKLLGPTDLKNEAEASSTTPTPVLTNETNSPQSSSPSSSHVSAVGVPAGDGPKKASAPTTNGLTPQVQEEEA